ncbi:unnamed protein product [Orchesella dallaii]|uniref:procollagen-proline 4-dioxygenase n=1 Tax=Orchesella dallaii TaxID=48710 RepID=A0ABP1RIG8_9HEXA
MNILLSLLFLLLVEIVVGGNITGFQFISSQTQSIPESESTVPEIEKTIPETDDKLEENKQFEKLLTRFSKVQLKFLKHLNKEIIEVEKVIKQREKLDPKTRQPETWPEPDDKTDNHEEAKSNEENLDLQYFPHNWNSLLRPQYAYATSNLIDLVRTDEFIYEWIKRNSRLAEKDQKLLLRYLQDYNESSGDVIRSLSSDDQLSFEKRAKAIVSNPLSSFRLIRRVAVTLPEIRRTIGNLLRNLDYLLNMKMLSKTGIIQMPPSAQDLNEFIEALLRIQYYNGYSARRLSNGEIGSFLSGVKLSSEQCMEIGQHALTLGKFNYALEWLRVAQIKQKTESTWSTLDPNLLESSMDKAIEKHNKAWDESVKLEPSQREYYMYTTKIYNSEDVDNAISSSSLFKEEAKKQLGNENWEYHIVYNFINLCSGENLQSNVEKSWLFCWNEQLKHPYFAINPMKMELLNENPPIVQVYDVMGPKLMEEVQNFSINRLERSYMINHDNPGTFIVNHDRTSSQTWIHDRFLDTEFHRKLLNYRKLVEKIMDLEVVKTESSESLQVACYGTSHHYGPHLDARLDHRVTDTGDYDDDRIGTFMLYLSSVEQGGKTAFPVLGIAAEPIEGSGVFWYNFKRNGMVDRRTYHGACPVAHGIKWVMNTWIHTHDNFLRRPCGLRSDE